MSKSRFRPSPSMIVALIALFVSIGGVGYAASTIGTSDLENGAVTATKLHKNAVTKVKIRNSAVNGNKVASDSLTGADIFEDTLGEVPSAKQAKSADNATSADNAKALGGDPASAFERSTRILYASGTSNAPTSQLLFTSSVADFDLGTDGDGDNFTQLLLTNHNTSGNLIGTVFTGSGPPTAFGVMAGTSGQIGPATGTGTDFLDTLITDAGKRPKSVWVHCLFNFSAGVPSAFCWGIQASA